MADKTISELPAATSVGSGDLFVLEQSNAAKKLTGQILENWLVSFADGHGGIQSIVKTGTSGTNPVVDTYTITLADETTSTFTVTNGIKGDTGAQTYVWVKWAAQNPTADNQMSNNPDEWIGIYIGLSSTAPTHYTDYTWYKYKGEQGNPGYAVDEVVWHDSTGGNVPGIAGATDTYYMYLDDPNNTFAGQFVVYNGQDGQGSPGSHTPLADSGTGVVGTAAAYSREDHCHPLNVDSTNPAALGVASPGSAATYARRDHVHKMPSASDVGALPSDALQWTLAGSSTDASTAVTYPSTASEILIFGNSNHASGAQYSGIFLVDAISGRDVLVVGGYSLGESDYGLANVTHSSANRTIAFRNLVYGNSSTGSFSVYYR